MLGLFLWLQYEVMHFPVVKLFHNKNLVKTNEWIKSTEKLECFWCCIFYDVPVSVNEYVWSDIYIETTVISWQLQEGHMSSLGVCPFFFQKKRS